MALGLAYLMLVRVLSWLALQMGYVGWVGSPEEFPTWAARYFRLSSADRVDQG